MKYIKGKITKIPPNNSKRCKNVSGILCLFFLAFRLSSMKNTKEKGFAYCPCKPLTSDSEANKKIICPCSTHKEEIEKDGHCHCYLFFKK